MKHWWRQFRFRQWIERTRRHLTIHAVNELINRFPHNEVLVYRAYIGASIPVEMHYANIERYLQHVHLLIESIENGRYVRLERTPGELTSLTIDDYLSTEKDLPVTPAEALTGLRDTFERLYNAHVHASDVQQTYYNRQAQYLLDEGVRICEWLWRFRP